MNPGGKGSKPAMTSNRPYLLRALYEWILDNDLTPCVLVNARDPAVSVPAQYIEDGRIVLNVAPAAIRDLTISNDMLEFHGRFGGAPFHVSFPVTAVLAIYARENGEGMAFPDAGPQPDDGGPARTPRQPPALKVVK